MVEHYYSRSISPKARFLNEALRRFGAIRHAVGMSTKQDAVDAAFFSEAHQPSNVSLYDGFARVTPAFKDSLKGLGGS
jgi:hypothetical protein